MGNDEEFYPEYTVYAPDLLGYGKSDKPDIQGEKFYVTHIEAFNEIADQLEAHEFYLAGLSMGGAIAIGYGLKYRKKSSMFPIGSWGVTQVLPVHILSYSADTKDKFGLYGSISFWERINGWLNICFSTALSEARERSQIS